MNIHRYLRFLIMFLLAGLLITACSGDADPLPEEPDTEETDETDDSDEDDSDDGNSGEEDYFYKLIRVENFAGDTTGDGHATASKFFYSLEENKQIPEGYVKSNLWDVAFANIYNSYLSGNYGKEADNYGSGSSGAGGIYMVYQPFDSVTEIPSDDLFEVERDIYGPDDFMGSGEGWYFYDFGGSLYPDDTTKQHVAYPLFDGLTLTDGTELAARTLIIRTAKGNYAKLRITSIYKDSPETPTKYSEAPYFTFEYVLVPAGNALFEIKE